MIDPNNLAEVVRILREYGVSYLKTNELELKMSDAPKADLPTIVPITSDKVPFPHLIEEETKEIKHKVEEVTSLMKLSDNDLLERLFPDTIQEQEVE